MTKVTKEFDNSVADQLGLADKPLHDVLPLPSKGLFYKNKVATLEVGYLTAYDENILSSPNLIQSGDFAQILVDSKILRGQKLKAGDLIAGDFLSILLYLRTTAGYGDEYVFTLVDPKTDLEFKHKLNMSELKVKEIKISPDENGECDFVLPNSNKNVKFRYLTIDQEKEVVKKDNNILSKKGGNSQLATLKVSEQIAEIDGSRDRGYIETFVQKQMTLRDLRELNQYMDENEPGMDLSIEVAAPSGHIFQSQVPIGLEFFWGNNK
jgi:hypothetical protein